MDLVAFAEVCGFTSNESQDFIIITKWEYWSVKGECASVVCNLKGSIIHIINLSLNATKRVGFLIKMGLEVFNCMSLQNTIKVYKDWLSSHHDTSQAIHPGQQNKHEPNLKMNWWRRAWVNAPTMKTPANLWDAVVKSSKKTPKSIRQRKRVSQFEVLS